MEYLISKERFYSHIELVKKYMLLSQKYQTNIIEFRTMHEGSSSAHFFTCAKQDVSNSFEAFVSLITHETHFYEEWLIEETTEDNVGDILINFINPLIDQFLFKNISPNEAQEKIGWIVNDIKRLIADDTSRMFNEPSHWGIYINNKEIDDEQSNFNYILNSIVRAIGLIIEWNEISIFYETKDNYVLFSWATSA